MLRYLPLFLLVPGPVLAQAKAGWGNVGQAEEKGFSWTDPLWPDFWMAWTPATLAVFVGIFSAILLIGLLEGFWLRDGLERWLAGNAVMKRTFRATAIIAGLIERSHQGRRKSGRQATFSSDILYDTLRRFDPGHLLLDITRQEAMRGLVDFSRIEAMLADTAGRIDLIRLPRVPPLAAPLLLENGRIPVFGDGRERLAEAAAAQLMRDAGLS